MDSEATGFEQKRKRMSKSLLTRRSECKPLVYTGSALFGNDQENMDTSIALTKLLDYPSCIGRVFNENNDRSIQFTKIDMTGHHIKI